MITFANGIGAPPFSVTFPVTRPTAGATPCGVAGATTRRTSAAVPATASRRLPTGSMRQLLGGTEWVLGGGGRGGSGATLPRLRADSVLGRPCGAKRPVERKVGSGTAILSSGKLRRAAPDASTEPLPHRERPGRHLEHARASVPVRVVVPVHLEV